ncbi:hypothetical protein NQ315_011965 [Exocentrus adspersus]|uniref:Helicase ARIP4 n=1 Tax=Exocentrus adspersus TaxID=1586481 RepID=A0AAV8W156_9CUCU|nr:hypothetical protein NQ315_011965 [Exocentrus adspersus]
MDPVLQRFGDVTIQRLEKPKEPKVGPQSDGGSVDRSKESKDDNSSDLEDDSGDELPFSNMKRPLPKFDSPTKKFKFGSGDITLQKKYDDLNILNNFSETEMSDYDSESDMEDSESDLNEMNPGEVLNIKPLRQKDISEDEASNGASFFEKLVEQVEAPAPTVQPQKPASTPADEEYDVDIKEKLKEMGEISFETVKKGEKPKKADINTENEVIVTPARKPGVDGDEITGLPKGIAMRRNIREVMDETKLDESTLAAQRQEAERLRRVQEQQRLLRELQKQAAQERMQHKVISLLQGNQFSKPGTSNQTRIGNTVLVKLPNGQTKPMTRLPKRPFDLVKVPKNSTGPPATAAKITRANLVAKKGGAELTPSVSIAPVAKKFMPPMMPHHSDSDSEAEDHKPMLSPPPRPRSLKPPVPTIDISSDDDCIVVSEPEGEDEEPEHEDPGNSGMHTNDEFNQPDEQGRVLVNVGHPDDEPDIFVAPQVSRIIKPHQIGGVRFLYDNVVESTNRFESSSGFGCILAHSMGLGKTLQIVTFSDVFLRHTPARTILCIMPINTLQNWLAEYNMWLPTEENAPNSPLNAHGEVRPRTFNLHVLNDSHKTLVARAKVIHEWRSKGGVLLIGYEQFRLLSLRKFPKSRKKGNPLEGLAEDDKNKMLFDEVHAALVKPGPDLVICDEGHRIKNSHASISQALKQMETKRRVVLTGYPLQNNLMEYWCMVDFVRPNYLGSKTEFCNMFERPIMNGQCIDSTEADIKLMRYRAHVLHSLLLGFVQRRSHAVLQTALPQKEEYVLLVRMKPFQRTLYETFMNEVVRIQAVPNPLKAFAVCCKIWNHPDVLYNFLKKRAGGEAVDIDLEEVGGAVAKPTNEKPKRTPRPRKTPAKGKNGKPAASITPYNSSMDQNQAQPSNSASGPVTSFSNTISGQGAKTTTQNFNQNTEDFQGMSQGFPETIPQPYYDQEFDQNAQFPSHFPNTPSNLSSSFPNTPNSSTNFNNTPVSSNNSFNVRGENQSQAPNQNNFMNLDSKNTLTPLNSTTQAANTFANLPSGISLTPVSSKARDNQAASLNNASASLTPLNNVNPPSSNVSLTSLQNMQPNAGNYMDITNSSQNQRSGSNYNQNQHYSGSQNQGYQNSYQDYPQQQNYWGQQQASENGNFNQQQNSNYFGPPPHHPFNPNASNSNSNNSWIKTEDTKILLPNHLISPKSETSNESKPKINIISDIKLPSVFGTCSDKKIKIISDIKIEPKEEPADQYEVKPDVALVKNEMFDMKPVKTEMKSELKTEDDLKPLQESALSKLMPLRDSKEDSGIPYDWAYELLKDYKPGCIENSAKMEILFCIIRESIALGDRLLVFSQSLITLDLIEQFLQMNLVPGDTINWAKSTSYYRLDGSTSALEREKLINEFNSNPKIHLFLVSTRAGSLGINLIGANRVVVLDASWNPCHDTQAVCRVYRYGQRKPCFVYRLVVDNCLEKKIYDRQINKQGMSDRVVDECNPDAHLTLKDVSTLCWDDKRDEGEAKDWSRFKDNYIDVVLQKVLEKYGRSLNKEPFQHESLLVDRKEKQLSQQEKRLAKKGYEREKQAARQPAYNLLGPARGHRPVASVRPMQQGERPSRWIPAEHWQRQGMTAQEMTLPLDVVIPTNQPEKGNIVLKAGQKVLVLKSPKGVYMQLESGKIVAIKTAIKVKGKAEDNNDPTKMTKPPLLPPAIKGNPSLSVVPQKRVVKPFTAGTTKFGVQSVKQSVPNLVSRIRSIQRKLEAAKTKPGNIGSEIARSLSKDDPLSQTSASDDENNQSEKKEVESADEIQKRIAMLKKNISIQRVTSQPPKQPPPRPPTPVEQKDSSSEGSALEQLEHTTSSVLNDNTPFQDTLDSITSAYQATNEDNLDNFEDDISENSDQKHQEQSEVSDEQSDEVTYVSEQSPTGSTQYSSQNAAAQPSSQNSEQKSENPEYGNYNNYYTNYNVPPYHAPPPPSRVRPQQPQYNYGYQGYPPPQPHYPPPPPQPGYDYNAPPPPAQPIYSGYHNPYPQQYAPPPQGMYPPPPTPAPAPPYTEYQQYPPMNNAPPPAPYYPNS